MRRALVNDVVHSFCYVSRHSDTDWPCVIFSNKVPAIGNSGDLPEDLTPFVSYALSKNKNYIKATRTIVLMMAWLRTFSAEEQSYAVSLLERYYGYRPACVVVNSNNQLNVQ